MSVFTLEEILKGVAAGEEKSFRELFCLYKERIYAYAMHFTRTVPAAEEIVQEVFLKLWLHRETLAEVVSMEAYLYTVTRNLCFDYMKKMAHEKAVEREWSRSAIASEDHVEMTVTCNHYKSLVHQALDRLPPQQKKIYTLSFYQGHKHEEIAKHLRISRNTVKVHLAKARAAVRSYLTTHLDMIILLVALMLPHAPC